MIEEIARHCLLISLDFNGLLDGVEIELLSDLYHTLVPGYQFLFQFLLENVNIFFNL